MFKVLQLGAMVGYEKTVGTDRRTGSRSEPFPESR